MPASTASPGSICINRDCVLSKFRWFRVEIGCDGMSAPFCRTSTWSSHKKWFSRYLILVPKSRGICVMVHNLRFASDIRLKKFGALDGLCSAVLLGSCVFLLPLHMKY